MFLTLITVPVARPASLVGRGSASSWPPAPTAPCAARMCPHLHSKVDTYPIHSPLEQLNSNLLSVNKTSGRQDHASDASKLKIVADGQKKCDSTSVNK